jgi:hypothetical protein
VIIGLLPVLLPLIVGCRAVPSRQRHDRR